MKAAIVVTSIHDCSELLAGYLENFKKYGREASIILIPDRKTPPQKLSQTHPIQIASFDLQEHFLKRVGFPVEEIPWNSDNRRNVGYLMALADGAEMIVSIDDDNFCPEDVDFIGEHSIVLHGLPPKPESTPAVGWFNNCRMLYPNGDRMYPRGFPYFARTERPSSYLWSFPEKPGAVRINAGMWTGDPDIDGISWLAGGKKVKGMNSQSVTLDAGCWCPINSQNTAINRDIMAAYWFVRMTDSIDRCGDIFQGYFAEKVAKHLGYTVRFGTPVVDHRRNSHNYLRDVEKEIGGILLLEELLPKLIEHKLSGSTVPEAYLSLADFIAEQGGAFYPETARLMRLWAETCRRING